jgi:hypothetical protein
MQPPHDLFKRSVHSLGEINGFKNIGKTDDTRGCDGFDLFGKGAKGT